MKPLVASAKNLDGNPLDLGSSERLFQQTDTISGIDFAYTKPDMKILFLMLIQGLGFIFLYHGIRLGQQYAPWFKHQWHEYLEKQKLQNALPGLLLSLSTLLQSGQALPQALKNLSTFPQGKSFNSALRANDKDPFSYIRMLCELSHRNGISLASTLKKLSHHLSQELTLHTKCQTLAYPLKLQAILACLIPWIALLLFGLIDFNLIKTACLHGSGRVGFLTALLLELGGFLWIYRILKK
ncbi:MAG: hypothetical protein HY390_02470 [Deltaproteobacteria bacterium]|nr:hypothetical protein [Deltaproteobacteria bacterium]